MEKEIIIKIEGENWSEALEKALKKANENVTIDGFRKGKAPKEVFIKKYGMTSLYMDAAEFVIDKAYDQMIKDNEGLELVAQPEIGINAVTDDYIEFKFTLTSKPEIKLGKYTNLNVTKEEVTVTKEELSQSVEDTLNRYTENVSKETEIIEGNIAIIDFKGLKDGITFEGGTGEDYNLEIGSNTFIPGFESQLIGLKTGDFKEVNVTFPEEYHSEDLKGQPVVFEVTVKDVLEKVKPELNADFFNDLDMEGVSSEEELKNQLEETIKARKDHEAEDKYFENLMQAVSKETEVEIPAVMIKEEQNRMIKQYEQSLQMQGLNLEQFYQFTNSNEDALKDQMCEEATNRVKYRLILEEISIQEKIEVTDKEAEEEAARLAETYQMNIEELEKSFGGFDMIKYDLKMRRAIEVLKK